MFNGLEGLKRISGIYRAFYYGLCAASVLHACFFLLFVWLDIFALYLINLLSCGFYVVLAKQFLQSIHRRDFRFIAVAATIEVILHAIVASYYLGLESGFHFYIIMLLIIPIYNKHMLVGINLLRLFFVILVYINLHAWLFNVEPVLTLNQNLLLLLNSLNILAMMSLIGLIAFEFIDGALKRQTDLIDLATTDEVTGVHNRHGLIAHVQKNLGGTTQLPFSILMMDVDFFKKINDFYGHQCGDYVLAHVAKVMRGVLRKRELLARWGGDEFIILLPNIDKDELFLLAERLRSTVEKSVWQYEQHRISITITIGGTSFQEGDTFESVVSRADSALYQGKNSGRNCFRFVNG